MLWPNRMKLQSLGNKYKDLYKHFYYFKISLDIVIKMEKIAPYIGFAFSLSDEISVL